MKVLVVENNLVDLKLVRAILQAGGHTIYELTSAEGAIELIEAHRPDVAIIDLQLSGLDGLDLIRLIRGNPNTSLLPILPVTAYPSRYPRAVLSDARCRICLYKPIDTRELANRVQEVAITPVM
ncbi:MAG TPA: response regulator [Burkholderiaceae bacterium]